MSTVSRRPRVKSISSAVLESAAVSCVEAIGALIQNAICGLDPASRKTWEETSERLSSRDLPTILPVSAIRAQMPIVREGIRQELVQQNLGLVEAAKLEALMTLQVAPYACAPAILHAPLRALAEAKTTAQAQTASGHLIAIAENSHRQVLAHALVTASRNASLQAGFSKVDAAPGIDGSIRVIATDAAGRALVTEIRVDQHNDPCLVTEVVGVNDGSCVSIMDRFDRALEQQGVRTETAERKPTGGVCQLATAREVLKKLRARGTTPQSDARRTPRLSQSPKIRI